MSCLYFAQTAMLDYQFPVMMENLVQKLCLKRMVEAAMRMMMMREKRATMVTTTLVTLALVENAAVIVGLGDYVAIVDDGDDDDGVDAGVGAVLVEAALGDAVVFENG